MRVRDWVSLALGFGRGLVVDEVVGRRESHWLRRSGWGVEERVKDED
jgi:hypothetical protein